MDVFYSLAQILSSKAVWSQQKCIYLSQFVHLIQSSLGEQRESTDTVVEISNTFVHLSSVSAEPPGKLHEHN